MNWYTNSRGLKPYDLCIASRTAHQTNVTPSSQSFSVSRKYLWNMDFKDWWNCSRAPCDSGWYGLEIWWQIFKEVKTWEKTLDRKLVPWSVCTLGRPKIDQSFDSNWHCDHSGIASGKQVALHISVNKYLFPDLGRGPTQSTKTCANYFSITGIGCNGAGGMIWVDLYTYLEIWHNQQYLVTSFPRAGQKCLRTQA